MRLNPWVAGTLNFFFPGLGFSYCGKLPFLVAGGFLFLVSMHPQFPFFTILSIIGIAITRFEQLTIQRFVSAFGFSFFWAVLGYMVADYINKKSIDIYSVGVALGTMSGIMSLLSQALFAYSVTMRYVAPWYLFGATIGFLVILGTWLAYKRYRIVGGLLVLLASMTLPFEFILMLIPLPIGSILQGYQPFAVGSPWLLFGLASGILMIHARGKLENEISPSLMIEKIVVAT